MANIAQMMNVPQLMAVTNDEKMIFTPCHFHPAFAAPPASASPKTVMAQGLIVSKITAPQFENPTSTKPEMLTAVQTEICGCP
jgi:hypothetical protein